jgi:hypothetical protein
MSTTALRLSATSILFLAWLGSHGSAKVDAAEPSPARQTPPPESLIFELRTHDWASWPNPDSSESDIVEVQARPGEAIGPPGAFLHGKPPFVLVEILDKHHARVRVNSSLGHGDRSARAPPSPDPIVVSTDKLMAWSRTYDAGVDFTVRIVDLDQVPAVRADDPQTVAAISAHARLTKDRAGSVQEVVAGRAFANADMGSLAKLNNLRRLSLAGSSITDEGVAHLKNMTRLISLNLANTKIGDAGLRHLAGLRRLEVLDLSGTDIGDEAVKVLREMKNCERIRLSATRVTPCGYWQLRLARPDRFPARAYGSPWGRLQGMDEGVGLDQLAQETGKRQELAFRLLVLGCDLRANAEGSIIGAIVRVTSETPRSTPYHTKEQTREAIKLLAELGTIETVTMWHPWADPQSPAVDEEAVALLAGLKRLNKLCLARCWLTDAGWLRVTGLRQLKELDLMGAKISGEMVRKLGRALPDCKISGRPSTDTKTP